VAKSLGLYPTANTPEPWGNRRNGTCISRGIRQARSFTRQAIRSAVQPLDRHLAVVDIQRADQRLGFAFYPGAMSASLLGLFRGVGVSLATPGVFDLPAWVICRRTREVGIRIAPRGDEACWLPWGTGIGLEAGSLAQGMLYGVPLRTRSPSPQCRFCPTNAQAPFNVRYPHRCVLCGRHVAASHAGALRRSSVFEPPNHFSATTAFVRHWCSPAPGPVAPRYSPRERAEFARRLG
jgi:hypothetical protein